MGEGQLEIRRIGVAHRGSQSFQPMAIPRNSKFTRPGPFMTNRQREKPTPSDQVLTSLHVPSSYLLHHPSQLRYNPATWSVSDKSSPERAVNPCPNLPFSFGRSSGPCLDNASPQHSTATHRRRFNSHIAAQPILPHALQACPTRYLLACLT